MVKHRGFREHLMRFILGSILASTIVVNNRKNEISWNVEREYIVRWNISYDHSNSKWYIPGVSSDD